MEVQLQSGRLDIGRCQFRRNNGETYRLTPLERKLLIFLCQTPGQVCTPLDLMEHVWGWPRESAAKNLKEGVRLPIPFTVFRLRNKIERDPSTPDHLLTHPGNGLSFVFSESIHIEANIAARKPLSIPEALSTEWVPRPLDEREAQRRLGVGSPLVVTGPRGIGKTTFIRQHLAAIRQQADWCVELPLDSPHRIRTKEPDRFMREFAVDMAEQLGLDSVRLEATWQGNGAGSQKLRRFVEETLTDCPGLLYLVIDPADALTQLGPVPNELFAALRNWMERGARRSPWNQLRLIMAVSTDPVLLTDEFSVSPFNLAPPVRLSDFNSEQTRAFLELRTTDDVFQIQERFGGNPALLKLVKQEAAWRGLDVTALGEAPPEEGSPLWHHCWERLDMLRQNPILGEAMRAILGGQDETVALSLADRLVTAGLVRRVERRYLAHNALYAEFFRGNL